MDKITILNIFGEEKQNKKVVELDSEKINSILGIKESFQSHSKIYDIVMGKEKNKIMDQFMEINNDLSYDWFTDYFQEEHSDRKNKKQDFTPKSVTALLSRLVGTSSSITDLCSGTGGLSIPIWNDNKESFFYFEEFSERAIPFLLFNVSIRNMNAVIVHCDSLKKETYKMYKSVRKEKYSDIEIIEKIEDIATQTVISNPPYSMSWQTDSMIYDKRFIDYGVAPKSKADFAFLLSGLSYLKDGKQFVILPHGVLFREGNEHSIRKKLIENNEISALIGLPSNLFLNTAIPTVLMILEKGRSEKDILILDASREFETKKPLNFLTDENIKKITDVFENRKELQSYSRVVSFEEIKKNNFNLNIPRYINTIEKEVLPSYEELLQSVKELKEEEKLLLGELSKTVDELVSEDPNVVKTIKEFFEIMKGDGK